MIKCEEARKHYLEEEKRLDELAMSKYYPIFKVKLNEIIQERIDSHYDYLEYEPTMNQLKEINHPLISNSWNPDQDEMYWGDAVARIMKLHGYKTEKNTYVYYWTWGESETHT